LISLRHVIERLEAYYGSPDPPETTDPWEMIVWENIAYLANDKRRAEAMAMLRAQVGVSPEEILAAPRSRLLAVAEHGIVPENSVKKLLTAAEIVVNEFDGDLSQIRDRTPAQARKALKRFPGIADPGAEKILLFSRALPVLALESNGLRALVRLGFGEEKPNYSATYRAVQAAIAGEIVKTYPWLIKAHQLLRRHGQTLCKTTKPSCGECPLRMSCPWAIARSTSSDPA
jgi:endonuclease III